MKIFLKDIFTSQSVRRIYQLKWIGIKIFNSNGKLVFKNSFFKKHKNFIKLTNLDMNDFNIELFQSTENNICLSESDIQSLIKTKTDDLEKRLLDMIIKIEIKDAMLKNDEYCMFLLECANKLKDIFDYDFFKLIYPEQIFDFLEKNWFSLLKEKDFLEYIYLPGKTSSYANIFPVVYKDKIKNFIIFYDKDNKKRNSKQIIAIKSAIKELSRNLKYFHQKKDELLNQLLNVYTLNGKIILKDKINFSEFSLSDILGNNNNITYDRIKIIGPENLKEVIQKNIIKQINFRDDYINISLNNNLIDEKDIKMLTCANIHFQKDSMNIIIPKLNCDITDYIIYDKL